MIPAVDTTMMEHAQVQPAGQWSGIRGTVHDARLESVAGLDHHSSPTDAAGGESMNWSKQHPGSPDGALPAQANSAAPAPSSVNPTLGAVDAQMLAFARQMHEGLTRLQMEHQFAVDEVLTKVSILRREFLHRHRYNPIEHVSSRVKSTESILGKATRLGLDPTPDAIRAGLHDIAGVRITCSFIADTYRILETLSSQADVRVLRVKD